MHALSRNEEILLRELEDARERSRDALVERDTADESGFSVDRLPARDVALEVAGDRFAEPLEHLVRLVALLLRVDHVGFGEHAAAPRDLRRALRGEDDIADVLDLVAEPRRLLVHEGTRARGAVAVRLVIDDADLPVLVRYVDELGVFAAHFEDVDDVPVERADAYRRGLELVLDGETECAAHELRRRAGDDGTPDVVDADVLEELVQKLDRRFERPPLDAAVARDRDRLRRIVGKRIDLGDGAFLFGREHLDRGARADERPLRAHRSDVHSQKEFHAFLPLCMRMNVLCIE